MNIKHIYHYNSVFEVLRNHLPCVKYAELGPRAKEILLGAEDYEAIEYIVVEHRPPASHETVIAFDTISGDVLFSETMDELFEHTVEFLREEASV